MSNNVVCPVCLGYPEVGILPPDELCYPEEPDICGFCEGKGSVSEPYGRLLKALLTLCGEGRVTVETMLAHFARWRVGWLGEEFRPWLEGIDQTLEEIGGRALHETH